MNNSAMEGRILSGRMGGMLEHEPPIHRHQQYHIAQMPLSHHHHIQAMGVMTALENEQSMCLSEPKGSAQKNIPMTCIKGNGFTSNSNTSDEDEPSFVEDGKDVHFNGAKGKKSSPWQRMKWTSNIVRLLITVVSCVGDDGALESVDGPKRKSGVLHKKGKWKTVSKIMMEQGCYVSPQQCEDKFNDLNKRYKRLNEILGRGTTCRVVENPLLLDSMSHLAPKLKDDVRKILSSKHLFYKEMCAYHNGQRIPNVQELELQGYSKVGNAFEDGDEGNDDCNDDLDNEDDERVIDLGKRKKMNEEDSSFWSQSGVHNNYRDEMNGMLQDTIKSPLEQPEWIRNRALQLQEQRVSIQAQAFELEKRRFKWQRFCSKKDWELERLRLEKERLMLENERLALQVKMKELEIDFKRPEASMSPVVVGMDRLQGRDQIDLGRF
ncbi:uncharacterized protein LOC143845612 [Tasmannia lanceolata]|uniref:uncharacterized protein LOC143845612 n=1 Tax=Tasmannia lanceolata TaxID=3420 RepID=UPI004063BB26